jgi:tetratricopeptide (TPR) repeat protein
MNSVERTLKGQSFLSGCFLAVLPLAAAFAQGQVRVQTLDHIFCTDEDIARVNKALETIPPGVQRTISEHGISVVLTPRMDFDEGEKGGEKIFREGGVLDNVGGMFEAGKSRVIIPECASWRNSPPRPQGNYITAVARHELGHAWDYSLNRETTHAAYMQAYDQDFKRLGNQQCRDFAYYITGTSTAEANVPTASGRAELFASLFAVLCTPVEYRKKKDNSLLAAFPHVAAHIQSLDSNLLVPPKPDPKPVASKAEINENVEQQSDDRVQEGLALWKEQRQLEAVKYFEQAIKLNPKNAKALLLCGNANAWLKNYRLSIANYSDYLKLNPEDAQVYLLRARAYGWLGEKLLQSQDEARAANAQKRGKNQ